MLLTWLPLTLGNATSSAVFAELQWWPTAPLRAWAVSALGHAAGDTAQDHWLQVAEWCSRMFLLQMRKWAVVRVAAIRKGAMAAARTDTQDGAEGLTQVVALMGDKGFLPCDDEVRVAYAECTQATHDER